MAVWIALEMVDVYQSWMEILHFIWAIQKGWKLFVNDVWKISHEKNQRPTYARKTKTQVQTR